MSVTQQDIDRWRFRKVPEETIARWIRNDDKARAELIAQAQRIAAIDARRRGVAPGTPADAAPVVIEQPAHRCAKCEDKGVYVNAGGALVPCNACGADVRMAEARVKSLDRYSSGLSARTSAQTFSNFEADSKTAPIVEACRRWATSPAGWLVVWGDTGCGKSHLCAAVFNALRHRKQVAVFVTGPDLMQSLKHLMNEETAQAEGETVTERTEKYQKAPVLIIDDMRAEQHTPWSDGVWFSILDYRYRNQLPTMIATNEDPAGEVFPARISSRIRDEHKGFSIVLRNMGKDMRVTA
jgi:DNA replication protein DnaC